MRPVLIGSLLLSYVVAELTLGAVPRTHFRVVARMGELSSVGLDCYPSNPHGYFDLDLRDALVRQRFESFGESRINGLASHTPYCVELRYNSHGLRDRALAPRRPGVRRVIVVGNSFTEGQGVKEADAYPRVLETKLDTVAGERWEVLNFGRHEAAFPALYDDFVELLAYDPDVVVYGMTLDDCELSPGFRAQHPLLSDRLRGRGRSDAPPSLRPFGLRTITFIPRQWETFRVNWEMNTWYRGLYGAPNHEGWGQTRAQLEEMHRRLHERGGHLLVAVWPILRNLGGGYPLRRVHQTVGEFCQQAGIAWLDLLPALQGHSSVNLWVHPVDAHPNERAHRLVAEQLSDAVRRLVDDGPG